MLHVAGLALLLAPQDRLDLPPVLESWYAVTREDRTLGVMRERIERTRQTPGHYVYTFRLELGREDLAVDGLLDETLLPLAAHGRIWRDEAASSWFIHSAGDARKLERADGTLAALAPDDRALPALAIYALRQDGRMSRPGRVRAALGGRDVEIEIRGQEPRDVLGRSVPLTRLSFPAPPPAPSPELEWIDAWADKYGRLVEIRLRGGARIALLPGEEAFRRLGWLPREGRRDPLARPDLRGVPAVEGPAVPVVTADAFDSLVRDLARRVEELGSLEGAEGRKAYLAVVALWKALRAKSTPEKAVELDVLRDRAEALWPGAGRTRDAARELYAQAMGRVERLELAEMEADLARLAALAGAPELEGRPERLEVLAWIAETRAWTARCRTRKELAEATLFVTGTTLNDRPETLPLDVSVQVYGHLAGDLLQVPFFRHEVYAVVNGDVCRPGDVIRGTSIRLEAIRRHSVQFSLRDELRDVPLRQR